MSTPLRIVAGVATPGRADPALEPAIRLAEHTGAELHLVHVPATDTGGPAGEAQARLEAEVRALTRHPAITCAILPGRADEVLPRLAGEVGADLLVLGRSRRGGAAAAVLGTTAQRILRASSIPMLVLRPATGRSALGRVLMATDLSRHSAHALTAGAGMARVLAQPVEPRFRPLHVMVPAYQAATAGIPGWSMEHAERELAEFLGELPGFADTGGAIRIGETANEILAEAAAWKADLIVVGTHGRRGIPRFLLGSVAETVVRRAEASVLVIPPLAPAHLREWRPAHATAQPRPRQPVAPEAGAGHPPPQPVPARCILVATDLSGASDHVLRSAGAIAAATGAGLHVLHAFDLDRAYAGGDAVRATFQSRIHAAEASLREQVSRTVPPEVTVVDAHVEIYAAHRAIAEHADAIGAELVVVGAHTGHGSHLGLLGSTTDRLIRTLEVPCLVVRTDLAVPLHRVVVPVDTSNPARAALDVGVRWAGALGERGGGFTLPETDVAVLHVLPQLMGGEQPFERAVVPPGLNRQVDAAVSAAGAPSNVIVREDVLWNDRPADGIVSFAWRERADLLVMATHGHSFARRALIGSTTASVVRRAPCPVLLVPPSLWRHRAEGRADARARPAVAAIATSV